MSMFSVFDVAASGMAAQSVRLNTVASNLANADSISTTAEGAYRARMPVFREVMSMVEGASSVAVSDIVQSTAEPVQEYNPAHPLANEDGYVFRSNVNVVEEMANMTSASRSYQSTVEALTTVKRLMLSTLRLGQ